MYSFFALLHTLYPLHYTYFYRVHCIWFQPLGSQAPPCPPTPRPIVRIIVLTISQEDKTITKPITVLVSIFFPAVLADSDPPNIKTRPATTAIIAEAIGAIVKTRKFMILTNPTNKSQGLHSRPLQGTSPAAETDTAKNIRNKTEIDKIKCLLRNIGKN